MPDYTSVSDQWLEQQALQVLAQLASETGPERLLILERARELQERLLEREPRERVHVLKPSG
jgi:hypothetical protein